MSISPPNGPNGSGVNYFLFSYTSNEKNGLMGKSHKKNKPQDKRLIIMVKHIGTWRLKQINFE